MVTSVIRPTNNIIFPLSSASAAKASSEVESVSSLKQQIRSTSRFITRLSAQAGSGDNAATLQTMNRKLAALQSRLTALINNESTERLANRYKMVRFFEGKKAMRRFGQALHAARESSSAVEALREATKDVLYVNHFAPMPYVSLYADGCLRSAEDAELRARLQARLDEIMAKNGVDVDALVMQVLEAAPATSTDALLAQLTGKSAQGKAQGQEPTDLRDNANANDSEDDDSGEDDDESDSEDGSEDDEEDSEDFDSEEFDESDEDDSEGSSDAEDDFESDEYSDEDDAEDASESEEDESSEDESEEDEDSEEEEPVKRSRRN